MPDRELADGALIVAGGALLLTPGFLTDVVGFLFILPFTRPLVRRLGAWFFARRIRTLAQTAAGPGLGSPFGGLGSPFDVMRGQSDPSGQSGASGPVIHGEVVRDEPSGSGGPGGSGAPRGPGDSGRDLTDR